MKISAAVGVLLITLMACEIVDDRLTTYRFFVNNQSVDTVQVCAQGNYTPFAIGSGCRLIAPGDQFVIASYSAQGELIDYWAIDDVYVLDELNIYKDSMLVNKDFLQRSLWVYEQNQELEARYTLILTDQDLQ